MAKGWIAQLKDLLGKLAIILGGMAVVGCVITVIVRYRLDHVKVFAGFMAACGLLIFRSGVKIVRTPEGRRLMWNPPAFVLGLSLMAGAALYSVFKDAAWLMLSLSVPVFGAILFVRLRKSARRG